MDSHERRKTKNHVNEGKESVEERNAKAAMKKEKCGEKGDPTGTSGRPDASHIDEADNWVIEQNLSKEVEDILGQSTPLNKSYEEEHSSQKPDVGTYLDVSKVQMAEESQKQQCERLEQLWKQQSEQNQKIFEKLDESMTRHTRDSSLREQHARQMEDLRLYYEGQISGLKKQLTDVKNAIFQHNQQEGSVKAEIQKEFERLSAANTELSSKCDALENAKRLVEYQLKQTSSQKQELETQCQQLVATNQIIDARSHEIKKIKNETGQKLKELKEEQKKLESRCDKLSKEKAVFKTSKEELERFYNQIQEDKRKLTDKCHKWKEESRILRDRNKTQESLIEKSDKKVHELERMVEIVKKELEDYKVKLEVNESIHNATQQRVDRLVVQNRDKDSIIRNLETKIQDLEAEIKEMRTSATKAGLNEIKESIRRDKELLKQMVHEYELLNWKHEEAKNQVQSLEDKLAESQDESQNLRREVSELNISRRNLENSLRQVLGNQDGCRKMVERSPRRTWQQSENFNFFTGEPFGCNEDVEKNHEKPTVTEIMESTRKKSTQPGKDELVDLSPIQSPTNERTGFKAPVSPFTKRNLNNKSKGEIDARGYKVSQASAKEKLAELSEQRRRVEAALVRISSSRISRQSKEDKKFLENKLDEILREIGKIRLKLKVQETV